MAERSEDRNEQQSCPRCPYQTVLLNNAFTWVQWVHMSQRKKSADSDLLLYFKGRGRHSSNYILVLYIYILINMYENITNVKRELQPQHSDILASFIYHLGEETHGHIH